MRGWIVAVLLLPIASAAQDQVTADDLAGLCIVSDTLTLHVAVDEDVAAVGISEDRLRSMIESQMRAARIYEAGSSQGGPYLSVTIDGILHPNSGDSLIYVREVALRQWVENRSVRSIAFYDSWSVEFLGVGKDASIMQGLSEGIDRFIGEFLRVNESDQCAQALENTRQHWRLRDRNNDYLEGLYSDDPIAREFRAYLELTPAQREYYAGLPLEERPVFVAFLKMSEEEREELGALPKSERGAYVERFNARQEAN